jgi:NADH pyrophosphatase NudC (nudix superfamily)
MLVESPDGGSALLGRSKKMRPGMLTCLSGFTDQVSFLSGVLLLP